MDPENCIRNGFANGRCAHSHFYAACNSRHGSGCSAAWSPCVSLMQQIVVTERSVVAAGCIRREPSIHA